MLSVFAAASNAGAWVQKKKAYFFKLTGSYLYTTEEYDANGNLQTIREGEPGISETSYEELAATGYLEYGASDRFTMIANLPFKIVTSRRTEAPSPSAPTRTVEVVSGGLSDLWLGGRFLLFGTSTPFSIQGGVKLPLGYDASPPDEGAPLGSGKVDVEGLVQAGMGIWPIRAYFTGQAGYRLRGGTDIADEYLFQLEGGFTPGNWLIKATLDGVYSTGSHEDQGSSTVLVTNQDILKIIPTVAYRAHYRLAIGAEVFHILSGKNSVAGTTYAIGIVIRN
jgi:hypothetical protein